MAQEEPEQYRQNKVDKLQEFVFRDTSIEDRNIRLVLVCFIVSCLFHRWNHLICDIYFLSLPSGQKKFGDNKTACVERHKHILWNHMYSARNFNEKRMRRQIKFPLMRHSRPQSHDPSDLRQGSRALALSNTGSPRFTDFPSNLANQIDWGIWNEYSAHAQKIGSGQSSRSLPQVRRIVALGTRMYHSVFREA